MKRIDLTEEERTVVDYHLRELSKKRAQIVSKHQTQEELNQLKDLERQCAFKVFEVSAEFARSTWNEIQF